jgi:plasmid stabilization system protein ParE
MSDLSGIFYNEKFNKDFEEIVTFISEDSEKNAHKFAVELKTTIERIVKYPHSGTLETMIKSKDQSYRFKTVMKSWKVIYRITETSLSFLRIIHNKRSSGEYGKL